MAAPEPEAKSLPGLHISILDKADSRLVSACVSLLAEAFNNAERYEEQRLEREISGDDSTFYRQFFVASSEKEIVGFGGIKAADWASHTHLLYLSAVAPDHRGQGIGRSLLRVRLAWLAQHFRFGRVLVSSKHARRFLELGFKEVDKDELDGKRLFVKSL